MCRQADRAISQTTGIMVMRRDATATLIHETENRRGHIRAEQHPDEIDDTVVHSYEREDEDTEGQFRRS